MTSVHANSVSATGRDSLSTLQVIGASFPSAGEARRSGTERNQAVTETRLRISRNSASGIEPKEGRPPDCVFSRIGVSGHARLAGSPLLPYVCERQLERG